MERMNSDSTENSLGLRRSVLRLVSAEIEKGGGSSGVSDVGGPKQRRRGTVTP